MSGPEDALRRLPELARNLWWSWQPEGRDLFERVASAVGAPDGPRALNPLKVLGGIDAAKRDVLLRDGDLMDRLQRVLQSFDRAMAANQGWFTSHTPPHADLPVAYFSAEFGVHQTLPVYSGGLGVLAGDIVKEASDLGLPLVGVGFMYPQGYFKQHITPDGRQEESYQRIEREIAPAETLRDAQGRPLVLTLQLPGHLLHVQVSRVEVGRVTLYLMDTDLDQNSPWERELTARLYGGDQETRLLQEILLGIGGVRLVRALGIRPGIWHANEGHAAFMMVERVREKVEAGRPFEQAVEAVRAASVFTTHTPVPAGHDAFPFGLIEKYLAAYWPSLGLERDRFLALGAHQEPWGQAFNMSVLAFRLCGRHSAVSRRHAEVSRRMWGPLWPDRPPEEAPIVAVTNGVHVGSWIAPEMDALFQRHLGADWMEHHDEPALWTRIDQVPDDELWAAHLDLKRRLHRFLLVRSRRRLLDGRSSPPQVLASGALFDPETLTLGFARRFATYKRASLIFRDPNRLRALVCDPRRPIQIVFAGKAHPADEPGKHMLQDVYRAAEDRGFAGRIAFVEDYGLHAAQHLVQGVDVWLNTPRPPLEASGTSGEKAALNGVPSLSILDGWWAEGYDGTNGWKIGSPDPGPDGDERDAADAADLYRCLEEEIVPAYYERDPDGLPRRWLTVMRSALRTLIPRFSARRMVKEYIEVLYRPGWEARGAAKAAADIPTAPAGADRSAR